MAELTWMNCLYDGTANPHAQRQAFDEIERLRELCGHVHSLLRDPPKRMYEQYTRHELCTKLREAAKAKEE